ncbi:MAG: hypothetical protein J0G29_01075 [Alphaproteobacteria bacterium]|nr:hypothetical protein [Alphaproteobacteria bacterium]OJV47155.1 MAG: hypothetical protein BGO28_01805 [Alphaproteobacteria bacterium 43-37]
MKALTIFSLALASLLFSAGASPLSANIDPAHEWPIVEVVPGSHVYARELAAGKIRGLNDTQIQEVIDLYRAHQIPKGDYGDSVAKSDCFTLHIDTEKDFSDFRIKEMDFPGMKTEKGISVIEYFFSRKRCVSR